MCFKTMKKVLVLVMSCKLLYCQEILWHMVVVLWTCALYHVLVSGTAIESKE
jgi:hypothetical protein